MQLTSYSLISKVNFSLIILLVKISIAEDYVEKVLSVILLISTHVTIRCSRISRVHIVVSLEVIIDVNMIFLLKKFTSCSHGTFTSNIKNYSFLHAYY